MPRNVMWIPSELQIPGVSTFTTDILGKLAQNEVVVWSGRRYRVIDVTWNVDTQKWHYLLAYFPPRTDG